MTLTIILFLLVLCGLILFGYRLNKDQSINKEDAMNDGENIREHMRKLH